MRVGFTQMSDSNHTNHQLFDSMLFGKELENKDVRGRFGCQIPRLENVMKKMSRTVCPTPPRESTGRGPRHRTNDMVLRSLTPCGLSPPSPSVNVATHGELTGGPTSRVVPDDGVISFEAPAQPHTLDGATTPGLAASSRTRMGPHGWVPPPCPHGTCGCVSMNE